MAVDQDRQIFSEIDYTTDPMTYHFFSEKINLISPMMIHEVFNDLSKKDTVENITPVLLRGSGSDLWNFMYFLLSSI